MNQLILDFKDPETNIVTKYLVTTIDDEFGPRIYRTPVEEVTNNGDFTEEVYKELHKLQE